MASRSTAVLSRLEPFGIELGLERMERLLAARGDFHHQLPTVLVAGTNGKGSTAAWLSAMCRAAGYRTGLYISPHLEELTERISVDGTQISDKELADGLQDSVDATQQNGCATQQNGCATQQNGCATPTAFEALTFAALQHFHTSQVDLAILEVGLGGRFDATNVCFPVLSIVTSIGLDHQEHLGPDLESIAFEKAGIARANKPLIGWGDPEIVRRVLARRCSEVGAHWLDASVAASIRCLPNGAANRQRLEITTSRTYQVDVRLPGQHQGNNLSQAILAAEKLSQLGWRLLDPAAITRGAAACRWPGRLEWVELPGSTRVLLDCAHNADAADALADYLSQLDGKIHLLFGALEDKAVHEMLPRLAQQARRLTLTQPPSPRAGDPIDWLPLIGSQDSRDSQGAIKIIADPGQALATALDEMGPDEILVVCGSTYLIGDARRRLRGYPGVAFT